MPTIKDVAKEAGVSIATVSYVMNDRNDMVSQKTRDHVLETALRMGYRANTIARNLQSQRTNLLAYAWHGNPANQPNMVMDQFIYQLAHSAESANYHLLTFTHPTGQPIAVYEDLIRSGRVDGFVLAGTTHNDERIQYLMEKNFPFVSFGRANPQWDEQFHWVDTDGTQGMYVATEYLIKQGHERIAFIGWPTTSLTGNYRLQGYLDAMNEYQLDIPSHYRFHSDESENAISKAFDTWQSLPETQRPTGLITVADYVAVAAMRTAEIHGYEIGKSISIIGFDDAPFVRYLQPGLTTLAQPLEEITSVLINMLEAVICGETPSKTRILLPPHLIVRGSTGSYS
ncbi:MAG: LacI family DNA-binding transcriptional regulator [Chloroflexota bacterium]